MSYVRARVIYELKSARYVVKESSACFTMGLRDPSTLDLTPFRALDALVLNAFLFYDERNYYNQYHQKIKNNVNIYIYTYIYVMNQI